ncbi:MAG TPA: RIP metalloprotease RseP, partial [candidate division WOR-3 bacterium]|nr:RIP metalloprotease RseP [candidate division WOR-3 bacterium]
LKWRSGDTDFVLSAIPFGGYVKMAGEEPEEGRDFGPDEFLSRPVSHRLLVVSGGPLANLVFGFAVYLFAYGFFGITTFPGNVVGEVIADSPAYEAGIQPKDTLIALEGKPFENWNWFFNSLKEGENRITILRGETLQVTLRLEKDQDPGIVPYIPPVVGKVLKGGPAYRAGIKPGDRILEINGQKVETWSQLVDIVQKHPDEELEIKWERDGRVMSAVVRTQAASQLQDGKEVKIGKIGIKVASLEIRLNPLEVVRISAEKTAESTILIFYVFYKIISGGISVRSVGGPIMIGKMIEETQSYGFFSLLILLALISINLFVVNILPLPALDGGHILVYGVEALTGKRLSPKAQSIIQQIGFGFIVLLIALIMIMDILRLLGR